MNVRFLPATARVLALALLYFATGRLGLMLPAFGPHITLLWLPSGIAAAALTRCHYSCWPGVTLGALAVNLTTGVAWPGVLAIALGNTAGPLLAASLLRRMGLHPEFDRRRDILLLAVAALPGMLLSASSGVATLALTGELSGDWAAAWLTWWAGDTMGVITVAPLVFACTRKGWRMIAPRLSEFLLWLCTGGLIVFGVFFMRMDLVGRMWVPSFLTLPLVAWPALRFGPIGTSFAIIMLSGIAASATATGHGALYRSNPSESAVLLWMFMATCAAIGWLISALQGARIKAIGIRHLLEQALSDVSLGVLLGDLDRKITYANSGFTRLTGYTEAEMLGKSCRILQGPGTDPATAAKLAAAIHGDGSFDGEILNYRKDGAQFWNALLISPVRNEHGETTGFLGIQRDITRHKEADAALKQSDERFRKIIEHAPEGIVLTDPASGRFIEANPAAERLFKLSSAELCKVGPVEMSPPVQPDGRPSSEGAHEYISRVMAGETPIFEWTHRNSEGRDILCEVRLLKIEIDGRPVVRGSVTDITARRQAEDALRTAGQKLRLHFDQTPMAVIEWDLEFRVKEWNPAARTIFGFSREEAFGKHASFIVPEKFRQHVDQVWQALLKKAGGERSSNENVTRDGRTILCEWYNTTLVDAYGSVVGVASVVMDITERRQAQELLAWEKDALELISGAASLPDVLGGLTHSLEKQAPGALCSILLLDDDGAHLRHGAAPSLPDAYNRAIDGAAIGPMAGSCGTAAYENRQVIVADIASDPLWTDYRALALEHGLRACWSTPIHGSKRKILGTFAIYYREPRQPTPAEIELIGRATHIISAAIESKQAEQALRESEVKFRTLFENAGDAIFLLQGEKFADCNPRTLEMFGCQARGQIVGHPPYEFSPRLQPNGRESHAFAVEKITAALAGRPQFFEWVHTKLDGTPFPAEVTLNTVVLGGHVMLQAIVRDISDRKRAEEEIRALNTSLERRVAERTGELQAANKELEAFSYSVSHDLKAPLRAVAGFSRIVVRNYADRLDDEGRKMLEMIRTGTQQMGRLIDDLLAFSRIGRQPLEPSPIDMHALAKEVFDGLAALEPGRKLRLDLRPLPPAMGTQAMIRQVWVNLLGNAIKFTRKCEVSEIEVGAKDGDGGEQLYYIKDNGAGFDMRHVDRLFGVFQRLHSVDEFEGTGIGLALVQRIVQRHGGRIWAEAEVEHGATFYFTLPAPKH